MIKLHINNKDAFDFWGIRMGDDFLNSLLAPSSLKDFIENSSRLEHGKRVLVAQPRIADREITLAFTLEGDSPEKYLKNYLAFKSELEKGMIDIDIREVNEDTNEEKKEEVFHLIYLKSGSYAMNLTRTFSKISVKFLEPNPADRSERKQ